MTKNLRNFLICTITLVILFFPLFSTKTQASPATWHQEGSFDTTWHDPAGTSFLISTASELAGLSVLTASGTDFTGRTIRLDEDIDLSAFYWIPIGLNSSNDFNGTFLGQGHLVTGLRIEASLLPSGCFGAGLFGYVNSGAVLDSVGTEVSIQASASDGMNIGGLAGYNRGNISGCFSTGTLLGGDNGSFGGLVGYNRGGIIKNSFSTVSVTAGDASGGGYLHAGGFAGFQDQGLITNGYAMGDLSAGDASGRYSCVATGGFIGGNNGQIENVYSSGNVLAGRSSDPMATVEAGTFSGYNDRYGVVRLSYYLNQALLTELSDASAMDTENMQTETFALLLTDNRPDPFILETWMQESELNEGFPVLGSYKRAGPVVPEPDVTAPEASEPDRGETVISSPIETAATSSPPQTGPARTHVLPVVAALIALSVGLASLSRLKRFKSS